MQAQSCTPARMARFGWIGLVLLFAINAVSIFGYATYSLNPELLAASAWASEIFSYSYAFFARAQIIVAFAGMVFMLMAAVQRQWLLAFAVVCTVSLLSETVGVAYGVPFGRYAYTDLLGPKFLEVPWLIPVSWFFMAVVCYRLATALAGHRPHWFFHSMVGALLLSAWDLTLDPAMSNLSPFWVWEEQGIYYGSPLLNLFGWFVTGFVLMLCLELIQTRRWIDKVTLSYALAFYAANLMLPLGLVICSGMWGPVWISLAAYSGIFLAAKARKKEFLSTLQGSRV